MRALAILVVSLIAATATPAVAGTPRIALVIGSNAYDSGLQPLNNAVNDAKLISRELANAGFVVEPVWDADQNDLVAAMERFTVRLKEAGPGAVGLFYFAGHGLQYRGTNYLLGTNAVIEGPADISGAGLDPVRMLWAMQDGGAQTSIVILDACREDRVSKALRAVADQGLAQLNSKRLDQKRNRLIVYSTGSGETAADGTKEDGNSPFATILAENMRVPDQDIFDMLRGVSAQMVRTVEQKPALQVEWGDEEFAFVGEP